MQGEGGECDDDVKGMWDDDGADDTEEDLERDAHVLQLAEDGQGDAMRQELSEYIGSLKGRVDEDGEKLVEFPQDFDEMLQVGACTQPKPHRLHTSPFSQLHASHRPSSAKLDAIFGFSCALSTAYMFELDVAAKRTSTHHHFFLFLVYV